MSIGRTRNYTLTYKGEVIAHYASKKGSEAEAFFSGHLGTYGLTAEQFRSKECEIVGMKNDDSADAE